MVNYYFDTSALVKHYITEVGSPWVQTLLGDPETAMFTSLLTHIEGACTFARRRREGLFTPDDHHQVLRLFNYDIAHRYTIVDVDPVLINTARQMANQHPLRAYDAVQLATAWLVSRSLLDSGAAPLTFVCADVRLLTIAQAEGLLTENPNTHP
ncbi:MAG: type II toxin-antitoxin system VapC family toxin [Anaerolineae bacterium]|nr:type II toxin-antitoxin system VapC family toxin [Anaerolineae bacterium]